MAAGRQINLDKGEGTILDGYLTDDIRGICTFLEIIFECKDKLVFGATNKYYFTYCQIDWVPIQFSENKGLQGTWHYEITAYPVAVFELLDKPCKNTQELARALKLNLTNLSISLPIPCPIINQYAGNFIQDNRFYSLEQAYNKKNMGEATYIYVGTKELYSASWKTIVSQVATVIELTPLTEGGDRVSYQDDQIFNVFSTAHGPQVWTQNDFISKLIGTHFTIETATPALFLNVYTMKFKNIPEFDTGLPFLCCYSRRDITNANAFVNSFANIKYIN